MAPCLILLCLLAWTVESTSLGICIHEHLGRRKIVLLHQEVFDEDCKLLRCTSDSKLRFVSKGCKNPLVKGDCLKPGKSRFHMRSCTKYTCGVTGLKEEVTGCYDKYVSRRCVPNYRVVKDKEFCLIRRCLKQHHRLFKFLVYPWQGCKVDGKCFEVGDAYHSECNLSYCKYDFGERKYYMQNYAIPNCPNGQ